MLSFEHCLVVVSVLISSVGGYAYIRDTYRGSTKPNRVTWSMWALAPLIGTAAALAAGADGWTVVRTFMAGFIPFMVFIASFWNRASYWQTTPFDISCGALSLGALFAWIFLGAPAWAVPIAALGDFFAALPTIIKAWRYPETETGFTYVMSLVSVLLVLPSIHTFDLQNASFQMYLLVVNVILILAVYRKRIFSKR